MKKRIPILTLIFSLNLAGAADDKATYATPEAAANNPDFAIQGEYKGDGVDGNGNNVPAGVQIVALGKGMFSATVSRISSKRLSGFARRLSSDILLRNTALG
jgi:hypothetical protein